MLIGAAGAAGAQIEDLPPGGHVEHDGARWSVRIADRPHLRAALIIDATGRAARSHSGRGPRDIGWTG